MKERDKKRGPLKNKKISGNQNAAEISSKK